ncbi:glycine oxidase ThiO [Nocardioides campestrisoli]|uniref:glycine oxidase ThiO n=1 Tax=Nocardioides campestrisoli TaxID=2736757 RepID=UPI00163DB4F2|nr:glycine oxidase ThiO [Nocardioides campestrisoli]
MSSVQSTGVRASGLRVRVLGAGIVGLTCAEELVRRGHRVSVWDPAPGSGASYAAAGMLCPAGETWHGETDLLETGRASARLWPALAARLGVRLDTAGTLLVGHDAGDLQEVGRQAGLLEALGEPVEPVDRRALARTEPCLGRAAGGFRLPEDLAVDPRSVVRALLARLGDALCRRGWDLARDPAPGPDHDAVVVATGARLPAPFAGLVRGVRGEVLRVRSDDPPRHVVRGLVRGRPVYVVPRADGELVVGATVEEHDAAPEVTAGGVHRLLDDARTLLPGLDRATWLEATARDRPGTRDNRPLVGPTHLPGVLLAAGHSRHGVLLAPLTARLVADHLESGTVHHPWDPRRNP